MNILEQIRTTQGRFPCKQARFDKEGPAGPCLHFDFCSPHEAVKEAFSASLKNAVSLEDLAYPFDREGKLDTLRLAKLAEKTGPLFGANETELLSDWLCESQTMRDVLTIQEVINGHQDISHLEADENQDAIVAKSSVKTSLTSNSFNIYTLEINLSYGASDMFFKDLPAFPFFKRFTAPKMFDYVFVNKDSSAEDFISVTLLSFKREISALDFAAALGALGIIGDKERFEQLMCDASEAMDLSTDDLPKDYFGLADSMEATESSLTKDDLPHLQKLVHAITSLRLQNISIDVFRSAETDDFMVFPSYLSYLWYGFAKQSDQVKIGFCARCGRGFSLTGHRGIARSYCSEACKTKAKNARMKRQRDDARTLFMQGLHIEEIAKQTYAFELSDNARPNQRKTLEEATELVQYSLSHQPSLKKAVDADLRASAGAPLTKRCLEEGVFTPLEIERRIHELNGMRKR